ncbi:hypothetical protein GIB67_030457 [Kingdonia uniflora]|uniref:Omega-hydroxypalmitate O-feruloyl transferase n=1 Tax=Kingdonia uniflora TaxID=39325 RepID=A0A7J7P730_9MAGN|nr:hypothetical protein GIB67_030457 [Kingdonia uniflora]
MIMESWIQELKFPQLDIPVTVNHVTPVMPFGPIKATHGDTLYLSNLDNMIGARVFTPTIYFFRENISYCKEGVNIVEVFRDALAKVLVPYYPFSGRLRETKSGKMEVFFEPNQGALIVDAKTEMTINDLGDLEVPNPAWCTLIYRFSDEEDYKVVDMPLVIAQVTKFSCGGFSLGLRLCHCLCDGFGAMQFVSAWAATAREGKCFEKKTRLPINFRTTFVAKNMMTPLKFVAGTTITTPKPCWDRECLKPRDPPLVRFPHIEFMRTDDESNLTATLWESKPVQKCYRINEDFQNLLKKQAQLDDGQAFTTFEAMSAHIWRSWVKALDVKPLDYELRLTFSVNARQKLIDPPLKKGFYGNVVCVACATSKVSQLKEGKLSNIAGLVRKARNSVSEEYVRSTIDYIEVDRPTRLEFAGKLTITQWTRFSIYECADFGWGFPVYAGPIDITPTPQVCVILPDGGASVNKSFLVCICLSESAALRFRDNLFELS